MTMTAFNFEKFAQEPHIYMQDLAARLEHSDEGPRTLIIWKAVMHTIRDRIHMGESLDLISQLPVLLRGFYVDGWKYHEQPPADYSTMKQFTDAIKEKQEQYGEAQFDWPQSTEKIASIVFESLHRYLSEGQLAHIRSQLPQEVKEIAS